MFKIFIVIIHTFADLRDKNQLKEEDITQRCYICQVTKDESLKKKIDIKAHCKEDHYVWNYVYFLTYLHISNQNEFNPLQSVVWAKLSKNDISWIPIEPGSI